MTYIDFTPNEPVTMIKFLHCSSGLDSAVKISMVNYLWES